jgi:hypothetical protein
MCAGKCDSVTPSRKCSSFPSMLLKMHKACLRQLMSGNCWCLHASGTLLTGRSSIFACCAGSEGRLAAAYGCMVDTPSCCVLLTAVLFLARVKPTAAVEGLMALSPLQQHDQQ